MNRKILITRELDSLSQELAQDLQLDILIEPVIRIQFSEDIHELAAKIKAQQFEAIAFTSQNAVRAFSEIIWKSKIQVPSVKFFAIGDSTARHLKLLGVKPLVPQKNDAVQLAQLILEHSDIRSVLFPCAQHHLDDLPEWLRRQNIHVEEMIVYRTLFLKKRIDLSEIKGIVFMSPSAVKSFFSVNKKTILPCFAIGKTTASELQKHTMEIIVSDHPDVSSIFKKVKDYFEHPVLSR